MGAVWLHDAEHNRAVPIAQFAGDVLLRSDEIARATLCPAPASDPEGSAFHDGAWISSRPAADNLLRTHPDVTLADVTLSLPHDSWAATVEAWEGPVICVADAARSAPRLAAHALAEHLVPEGGIGAFVIRRLTACLDHPLNTP